MESSSPRARERRNLGAMIFQENSVIHQRVFAPLCVDLMLAVSHCDSCCHAQVLEKVRAEVRLAGELLLTNLAVQEVTAFMALRTSSAAAAVTDEPRLDLLAGAYPLECGPLLCGIWGAVHL